MKKLIFAMVVVCLTLNTHAQKNKHRSNNGNPFNFFYLYNKAAKKDVAKSHFI